MDASDLVKTLQTPCEEGAVHIWRHRRCLQLTKASAINRHLATRPTPGRLRALTVNDPENVAANAVIVAEAKRLHWRIWNGKVKNARISIDRIRAVMHHFEIQPGSRRSIVPSRKLWAALQALDGYLAGQNDWLVNYAERHRGGLRVGTAITEATAYCLVNRRMNKSQQMRWSPRGADLQLQVRCAVYNDTFASACGQPQLISANADRRMTPNLEPVPAGNLRRASTKIIPAWRFNRGRQAKPPPITTRIPAIRSAVSGSPKNM